MEASTAVRSESSAEAAAGRIDAFKFIERLGTELSKGTLNLPSFPEAVMRIQQVLNDPNATTSKVAKAVQSEPVFTGKLFRMVNSVMLQHGKEPVTDLEAVINRIGFKTVKNLAVALATRQIMNAKQFGSLKPQLRDLWEHSLDTAAIAFLLARDSGCVPTDDALLAGLLHDIGVYYIYSRMSSHPVLFEDAETVAEIIADWHTGIGHAILEDWDFSPSVVEAVDEHETFDRFHVGRADLTDVITTANILAHWHLPTRKDIDLATVPALERLELTPESALEKLEAFREDIVLIKNTLF